MKHRLQTSALFMENLTSTFAALPADRRLLL